MFIPLTFNEQCSEIHQMFLEFNAPISEKPKELNAEISDLLGVCDVCFKMPPEDAESVLNGEGPSQTSWNPPAGWRTY